MDLDTIVLHIAALILDRYTWIHPVTTGQYILFAIAAFLAAANLTPRTLEITVLVDTLIQFSNHALKKMDVRLYFPIEALMDYIQLKFLHLAISF